MASILARIPILATIAAIGGCSPDAPPPAVDGGALDPIAFFTGPTHGDGQLDKLFSERTRITVDSIGRRQGNRLIVDQTIREGSKPSRVRRWTIWRVGPKLYSGTLTEAKGPVRLTVTGPRAEIRYTMSHGLKVEQQLALQRDGKTILNRLDIQKFGVHVATLNETIRKIR